LAEEFYFNLTDLCALHLIKSFFEMQHYQAYLTWINCQLKKHPQAIRPIQDIRQELQDGTIVANLIEILGERDAQTCVGPHHLSLAKSIQSFGWKKEATYREPARSQLEAS
jgi:hypothetical protein